jgi:CubicO group peptidase (beta-lactamase class C family)
LLSEDRGISSVDNPPSIGDPGPAIGNRLDTLLRHGLEQSLYLGAVYAIVQGGSVVARGAAGRRREAPDAPAAWETVFDLASLTKPVATATSVLFLAQEGAFHLGEAIGDLLPAASGPRLAGVTVRHLLTHTSGLPAWRDFHSHGWAREEIVARVAGADREHPIGTRYVYSDLGYILLGALVEHVSGERLDRFAARQIFSPLQMADTGFLPADAATERLAATRCPRRGVLLGPVHDENAAALEGVAGHAGLFGAAPDLVRYATALLAALAGAPLGADLPPTGFPLSPLAAGAMARGAIDPRIGGSTLGWFAPPNGMLPAGDFLPGDAFGHTGFTGTSLVIAPALDLAVILLTNRVYQERDAGPFLRFRKRFHNTVAGHLTVGSF